MPTLNVDARAKELFAQQARALYVKVDRLMLAVLLSQWLLGIALAMMVSPYAWARDARALHMKVATVIVVGAALNGLPALLVFLRPGWWGTRHTITVAQMLWSALLIHLTGGRIETHFHIFGSLAFLAFYRDWKIMPVATAVIAADYLLRMLLWPESVYVMANPEWWRLIEYAAWIVFEVIVLLVICLRGVAELKLTSRREAEFEHTNTRIEAIVAGRTAELNASRERYRAIVETTNAIAWDGNPVTGCFSYVAPQALALFGHPIRVWKSPDFHAVYVHPDDRQRVREAFLKGINDAAVFEVEYRLRTRDERYVAIRNVVTVATADDGSVQLRGIIFDISEQKRLENELTQAQKLESVGRLASGVAHEINTPIQFVGDSIHFLREATTDMRGLLDKYQELRRAVAEGRATADDARQIAELEEKTDLAYLLENIPKSLERAADGVERVAVIVRSMKDFAHPDRTERIPADLNKALLSTITMAASEFKYVADVETQFGDLPLVNCIVGSINQVFLNLIVNAAHAIADVIGDSDRKGHIAIRTWTEPGSVFISIGDSGTGIPESIRDKVFEQFFTTKPVGKGTGQGLAIAQQIVTRHGGAIWLESELGKGTTFFIKLPIADEARVVAA